MISDPVTIGPGATLEELDVLCGTYRVSGLPVVDEQQVLLGIITNRDLRFVPGSEWRARLVSEVMTPMPLVTAPVGISTRTRRRCSTSTRSRSCRWSTRRAGSPA